jgi:long-chain fatty acid transport protein
MLWVLYLALASDTNYQTYVTGGRAAGLGGAFTAIANDPSGLLYNPAGLVDDSHTDISVSANLYGFERTSRSDQVPSPFPDLRNVAQAASELVIIPSTSGALRTFQKDPNGPGYLNAISAGVFVPAFRSTVESVQTVDAAGNAVDYHRSVSDRLLMPGVGYARKLSQRWRIGLSTFFTLRSVDANENIVSSGQGTPTPFRQADSTLALSAGSLWWILGVKWMVSDRFNLGLSFAPPGLPVFSSTSIRYYRTSYDPNVPPGAAQGAFKPIVANGLPSTYVMPATLRFGAAYTSPKHFTVAADLSLHFPTHYDLLRVPQGQDADYRTILPIATHVDRLTVVNVNVGAEWLFLKNMSISGGFYTDFSSAPSLAGPAYSGPLDRQALSNIDYYGFTAALGLYSQFTLTRIGVLYSFGKGYDVVTRNDFGRLLDSEAQYERVPQSKSLLYVFVSSTVRFE